MVIDLWSLPRSEVIFVYKIPVKYKCTYIFYKIYVCLIFIEFLFSDFYSVTYFYAVSALADVADFFDVSARSAFVTFGIF